MTKVFALIVAAGEGRRFGGPKQYALLRGIPLVEWSIGLFERHPAVAGTVLVVPDPEAAKPLAAGHSRIVSVVAGGPRRQDSVNNGFLKIPAGHGDIVLVHDGARPLAGADLVSRVVEAASRVGAAVPVLALEDTVKEVRDGAVVRTLDRTRLFRAQTPQGFRYEILKEALESALATEFSGTDESMLVERIGRPVAAVPGDPGNIKITAPRDLEIAEALLEN